MRYLLKLPLGRGGLYAFDTYSSETPPGFNPKLTGGDHARKFFRNCLTFGQPVEPSACFGSRGFFESLLGAHGFSDRELEDRFMELVDWNRIHISGTNEPPLMPFVEKEKKVDLDSLRYKPIDEVKNEPKKKTLELELSYDDFEETPAGNTPYKITFSNNECITGTLDEKGCATIPNTPDLPAKVEFGDKAASDEAENSLGSDYQRLVFAIEDAAKALGAHMLQIARSKSKVEPEAGVHADFKKAVEDELAEIKARSDLYNSSSTLQQFIAQGKATGSGIASGFADYVPDLGEFGDLMDEIDLDVTDLVDAIATGDVSELEKKLQEWKKRSNKGLEKASHTMEMLVLLLSDKNSRELIANLPVRLLHVMPPDEVTEIVASQATQTGIDYAIVAGGTAAGAAAGGVGGPIAAASLLAAAAARKGGKILEKIIEILSEIAKKLKNISAYHLGAPRNYKKKNKLPQTSESREIEKEFRKKQTSQPAPQSSASGGDQEPKKGDEEKTHTKQTGAGSFTGSADEAYNTIRASTTDIGEIAKNTGIKPSNVEKVKNHLFYDEHLLDRYVDYGVPAEMGRFDSDMGIANAWKLLENGTHTPDDMKLLKHETAESWYMRKHDSGYTEAHNKADKRFPAPDLGDE